MSTNVVFNPFTNNLDFVSTSVIPPGTVASLTGDDNDPVSPSDGDIKIQGDQAGHLGAISFTNGGTGQIYATVLVDGVTIAINGSGQLAVLVAGTPYIDAISSRTAASNTGYYCSSGIVLTLPPSPSQGDEINAISINGVFTVTANTGQFMQVANGLSSSGGNCVNTLTGDSITLRYQEASSTWFAQALIGGWKVS